MATRERFEINIFWHIYLVNHAIDIINEQLKCIVESGLYERVSNIFIGCIKSDKRLYEKLSQIIDKYDKIMISAISDNPEDYEFLTLNFLDRISRIRNPFYGLYIHTKGVNYPNNEGGKFWLDYMDYYLIKQWKEAVDHLDKGYELYGVKLMSSKEPPAYKMHYSGNFFWFWSDYITYLPKVSTLDKSNRGNAEMWVCSADPIAGTACQVFVDYNTKGKFEPFKIESNI